MAFGLPSSVNKLPSYPDDENRMLSTITVSAIDKFTILLVSGDIPPTYIYLEYHTHFTDITLILF